MPKTSPTSKDSITHADVHMYRVGTGDCLVVVFYAGENAVFKMMIDGGSYKASELPKYVPDLLECVGKHVNALIITHEHGDHVNAFSTCSGSFPDDFADEIWLAWSEKDGDKAVTAWKRNYGEKKMALAAAASKLEKRFAGQSFAEEYKGALMETARNNFAGAVTALAELHLSVDANGVYAGGLKGMEEVKKRLGRDAQGNEKIQYFRPGQVMENIPGLEGIRIYVLGPPESWDAVGKETPEDDGEAYKHSKNLAQDNAFVMAMNASQTTAGLNDLLPFESRYDAKQVSPEWTAYRNAQSAWRRIDNDWLMAAGPLALRLDSGTNNLSFALAIEFIKSGRVMLFPGDAEYGNWASWHDIDWKRYGKEAAKKKKHLTEDLLNRTVFFKVAHHLSHNGTAKRLGLEMMTHEDLCAMVTLDYDIISANWKSTMPNRYMLSELIDRTDGRLIIMNEQGLPHEGSGSVHAQIAAARAKLTKKEQAALEQSPGLCLTYRVSGT